MLLVMLDDVALNAQHPFYIEERAPSVQTHTNGSTIHRDIQMFILWLVPTANMNKELNPMSMFYILCIGYWLRILLCLWGADCVNGGTKTNDLIEMLRKLYVAFVARILFLISSMYFMEFGEARDFFFFFIQF